MGLPGSAIDVVKSLVTLGPVGESLADVYSVVIGDRIANWRLANAVESHKRVREIAEREGLVLNTDKIPPRFAYSWFEEASKQDHPKLQELFAKLLARSAAGSTDADERLILMLGRMAPEDAIAFELFYGGDLRVRHRLAKLSQDAFKFHQKLEAHIGIGAGKAISSLIAAGALEKSYGFNERALSALSRLSLDTMGDQIRNAIEISESLDPTDLGEALAQLVLDSK